MKHVSQRGDSDCGVAAFAMLTDRGYSEALTALGVGADVPDHTIRVLLQREGWFIRDIDHRSECDGVWPPPPFAERHFALVTQLSGNGHYVAMEADGTVLDPLTNEPRRLSDWTVCSFVCGMVRRPAVGGIPLDAFRLKSDCHGFDPPPLDSDWPTPLAEGGYVHCGCACHLPIGSGFKAECTTCVHCALIA